MLKGVGPAALRKISSVPNFDEIEIQEIANLLPAVARATSSPSSWPEAIDAAAQQIKYAEDADARIISPLDSEYPKLLAATKDDPFILFVQGVLAPEPEKSVAVIGTREPTSHGEIIASRITGYLVEHGWSIVSGLAIGCDALAHETALSLNGHTVAVMAHGLHTVAPARHRKLAARILESGGALVSEFRFGQDAQKQFFVKRDKTQAGLAQGVVMIQSDLVGGSLHASRASLNYGRWLAAPLPTDRDRANGEPKIQANLIVSEGTIRERLDLLHCSDEALKKTLVLRSREDYAKLVSPAAMGTGEFEQSEHVERASADSSPEEHAESRPPPLEEQLAARQRYIRAKFKELTALAQCLPESSVDSVFDAQFELEGLLAQTSIFIKEAERYYWHSGAKKSMFASDSEQLVETINYLQKRIHENGAGVLKAASPLIVEEERMNGADDTFRKFNATFNQFSDLALRVSQN